MKRVLVLGSSGSGKSTFARQLGEKLHIEVIHLDSHYWQPNWVNTPDDAWLEKLQRLIARESWVMDGNYPDTLPQRLKYADTAFFLDFRRVQCLWRCVNRFWKHRGENRPELAPGCYEKIDLDFLKWIWHYPRDVRPRVMAMLEDQPEVEVIVLKGSAAVEAFLKGEVV